MDIQNIDLFRKLFNEVDPVGIFFDTNIDEYDPEIREIVSNPPSSWEKKDVQKRLENIFQSYFEGIEVNKDKIENLSLLISQNFHVN